MSSLIPAGFPSCSLRRTVPLLLLILSLAGCASHPAPSRATANRRMTVRTTAYAQGEDGGSSNAVGSSLRHSGTADFSAASDWSWLPMGTRFRVVSNGRTYVIEDYGSALVGRQTIDLYVPSRREMNAWGVRNVEIEILQLGSKPLSLKLLAPRTRNSHVARMVAQLRKDGTVPPS